MEARRSERWLFGPGPDLLLGCGLGYLLIVAGFAAAGVEHASVGILAAVPLISILTGTPHYGATLLRVYEEREERRAYAFFTVWLTIAVWALFYAGLYGKLLGSLILTTYLTWSPWHYTGQNYGIAVMFLRRRGVDFTPATKRVLYASFLLSYVLTFLALHGSGEPGEYAPVPPYKGSAFHLMRLGLPSPLWEHALVAVGAAYLGTLVAAGWRLGKGGRVRELLPVGVIGLTQMVWFSFPIAARIWGWLGPGAALDTTGTAYAFFWIATGHSVQYLWITSYYSAAERPLSGRLLYLAKTLAAGSFIWSVPGLLYSLSVEGGRFGGVAHDQDVAILLAATVNIHHFILDGAIWKLRDGRVARILIRRQPDADRGAAIGPVHGRRWLAPVLYGIGALATLQVLASLAERQLRFEPALRAGDVDAAWYSLERMDAIRVDSAADHLRFGRAAADQDHVRLAMHAFQRSLEMRPSPAVWLAIGTLAEQRGEHEQAIAAYERALELNPDDAQVLANLGLLWLHLGEVDRAVAPLERAARIVPDNETLQASLARARQRSSRARPDPPS